MRRTGERERNSSAVVYNNERLWCPALARRMCIPYIILVVKNADKYLQSDVETGEKELKKEERYVY